MVRAIATVVLRRPARRVRLDAPAGPASVRVLLATFDGERWLGEQLASLSAQVDVHVSVVASDDASTDATWAMLEAAARPGAFVVLPQAAARFGNAQRNFMRLIRDTTLDGVEYFALSDQDDVWLPGKLARAVALLRETGAAVYSSNATAFWPDGRRKTLVKSQPQRAHDHLFESAGPGCSFVFTRAAFVELQQWVVANFEALQRIKVHDWLIYAFARERGWRWVIDSAAPLLYRQHERNEAGANSGWRAARVRLRNVVDGRFRVDALAIGAIVGARSEVLDRLRRFTFADRLWLAWHARAFRRAFKDAAALALMFVVMRRGDGEGRFP
jgi:rhamnosyltransferase